ncbi:PepSY domain-containing protein [Planomonospora corallina]|uniref:PepSY domain-containing protein n=1 Tax=Planomonospora corallina TaxID=1806052 RepID=A0ABV8I8B3_9ACTN
MRQRSMIARIALVAAGTAALLSSQGVALATGSADAPALPAAVAAADITSEQAVRIAKRKVPGSQVAGVRRVWDQGIWNWRVTLERGSWEYDLYVSVRSGRVVRMKINLNY